jgi:hypothetical protein
MALRKQVVTAKLLTGVSSKSDPKLTDQELLLLENARVDTAGEIQKRYGFSSITGSHNESVLADHNGVLVAIGNRGEGAGVKAYSGANNGMMIDSGADAFIANAEILGIDNTGLACMAGSWCQATGRGIPVGCAVWVDQSTYSSTNTYQIRTLDTTTNTLLDSLSISGGQVAGIHCLPVDFDDGSNIMTVFYVKSTGVLAFRTVSSVGTIGSETECNGGSALFDVDFPISVCQLNEETNEVMFGGIEHSGTDIQLFTRNEAGTEADSTIAAADAGWCSLFFQATDKAGVLWFDAGTSPCELNLQFHDEDCQILNGAETVWTIADDDLFNGACGARYGSDTASIVYVNYADTDTTVSPGVDVGADHIVKFVCSTAASAKQHLPSADAMARWLLNESGGTDAAVDAEGVLDLSAQGTCAAQTGLFDGARECTSYFSDRDSSNDLESTYLAVASWLQYRTAPSFVEYGILARGNTSGGDGTVSYWLGIDMSGKPFFTVNLTSGGATRLTADDALVVSSSNWRLIGGSFDGTSIRLYVDGVEVNSTTFSADTINWTPNGAPTTDEVQRLGNGNGGNFGGYIDETACYDVAKDESWFASIFFGPSPSVGSETWLASQSCIVGEPLWVSDEAKHYLPILVGLTYASAIDGHQDVYALIDEDGNIYGRFTPGYTKESLKYRYMVKGGPYTKPHKVDSNTWRFALPIRTSEAAYAYTRFTIEDDFEVNPNSSGDYLHIPCANPQLYDGRRVFEDGFVHYPVMYATASTYAGLLFDGEYGWCAVYEYYDSLGNRHQSAPTPVRSVTPGSLKSCDLYIQSLGLGAMAENCQIAIYRTTSDGSVYYRVATVANDPDAGWVHYHDSAADLIISTNEILYTQGELENIQPDSHGISCQHQNRVAYVSYHHPDDRVLYSKYQVAGEGSRFNDGLLIRVPPEGGDITALSSFMDRLVIFKEDSIYLSHGSGFTDGGGGSNYSTPIMTSSAIGCIDPKTICRIPQGICFLSNRGIYLLDKGLSIQPIGEAIRNWTDDYPPIDCAVIPSQSIAVWCTSSGNAYVYDYLHGLWCLWTNHACSSIVEVDGVLFRKDASTTIYKSSTSLYTDNGSAVSLKIRTGWFSFGSIGGYSRVYKIIPIGQNITSHTLRVKTAYDMTPYFVDNQTFDAKDFSNAFTSDENYGDGLASGYDQKAYMLEVGTSRQKCTSVMVEFSDESSAGETVTQGFSLSAIAFEIGIKQGAKRIGSARQL